MKTRRITLNSRTWVVDAALPIHDPIFSSEAKRGRKREYPFDQLKVGESVLIPASDKSANEVKTAAYRYNYVARILGNQKSRLLIRKQADGSHRVWRVPMVFVAKPV